MGATELMDFLTAGKAALDIFKGIRAELPKGPKADDAQAQIELAEQALQNSKAEAAKSLGYELCRCTFPPQIMLWKLSEGTNICPACGTKNPAPCERAPGKACPSCGALAFRVTKSVPHSTLGGILGTMVHLMKCDECGFIDQKIAKQQNLQF